MNLVVLVAVGLIWLALGLAAPVAGNELRQGIEQLRQVELTALARRGLADLESGSWIPAIGATPVGGMITFPQQSFGPRVTLTLGLERIAGDLWLASVEAVRLDQANRLVAASRQGLLLRLVQTPADTIPRSVPTSRPWVAGFE